MRTTKSFRMKDYTIEMLEELSKDRNMTQTELIENMIRTIYRAYENRNDNGLYQNMNVQVLIDVILNKIDK